METISSQLDSATTLFQPSIERTSFRFGLEMEVVLTHKRKAKDAFSSLHEFADKVIDEMYDHAERNDFDLPHILPEFIQGLAQPAPYSMWLLKEEVTIHTKKDSDQCMLEIPNPYLKI